MFSRIIKVVAMLLALEALTVSSRYSNHTSHKNSERSAPLSHDVVIGSVDRYDRFLFGQKVEEPSAGPNEVVSKDVRYSHVPLHRTPTYNIHYIRITDLKKDGTNGYGYIVQGGLGKSYVTLRFVSLPGHGLNFTVLLYGGMH